MIIIIIIERFGLCDIAGKRAKLFLKKKQAKKYTTLQKLYYS